MKIHLKKKIMIFLILIPKSGSGLWALLKCNAFVCILKYAWFTSILGLKACMSALTTGSGKGWAALGGHPQVSWTSVKHHIEHLGWRANADFSKVLSLLGTKKHYFCHYVLKKKNPMCNYFKMRFEGMELDIKRMTERLITFKGKCMEFFYSSWHFNTRVKGLEFVRPFNPLDESLFLFFF